MNITISEQVKPPPWQCVVSFERSLDPWHADAFIGTPAEGRFDNSVPRKSGWAALDWVGNELGFIADGSVIELP